MTFLEICEEEYKKGREDGIEVERKNTERERDRADAAEQQNSALKKEINELKRLLAEKEQ